MFLGLGFWILLCWNALLFLNYVLSCTSKQSLKNERSRAKKFSTISESYNFDSQILLYRLKVLSNSKFSEKEYHMCVTILSQVHVQTTFGVAFFLIGWFIRACVGSLSWSMLHFSSQQHSSYNGGGRVVRGDDTAPEKWWNWPRNLVDKCCGLEWIRCRCVRAVYSTTLSGLFKTRCRNVNEDNQTMQMHVLGESAFGRLMLIF